MRTTKSFFTGLFVTGALLACALISSCNSGLSGVGDGGKKTASGGRAYISSVSFGGSERAILPQGRFDLKGSDIYKFELFGTPAGGEESLVGSWTSDPESEESAYDCMDDALQDGAVTLEPGTYTFAIKVYVLPDGVLASDEGADSKAILVLEKTAEPMLIASGSNKIKFGQLNEAAGNGALSLTVRFPNEGVTNVAVTLTPRSADNPYSKEIPSLEIYGESGVSRSVVFSDNPTNGYYLVKFTFTINNGAGDITQVYNELVQIATGRTTSEVIEIENLNALYPIDYNYKGGQPKENAVPMSYSPYQSAIPLPVLKERNGAKFDGWFSDPYYTDRVTEIASGSRGAKKFYAKWKYDTEDGNLYAGGAKVIVKAKEEGSNVVYAYFDKVSEDNMVLDDNGGPLSIQNWNVWGCTKDKTYPDGTTDDITVLSGNISNVYAWGTDGSVTVEGGTVSYIDIGSTGSGGKVTVTGGEIKGNQNNVAIYDGSGFGTVQISGGKVSGNISGGVAEGTLIKLSGNPVIGNGRNIGIDLSIAHDKKIIAGDLNAEEESITLLAPSAEDGTVLATFEDGATAFTKFFVIMNANRKRIASVVGSDIKVEGGLSLPDSFLVSEAKDNTFTLEHGNITKAGTIFCVFADGGFFTLTETELATGVHFDMGIPVDENGKEKKFVYNATTDEHYRYIQFTSEDGKISAAAADDFLTSIEFHKIGNKPITVRINLETIPIQGTDDNGNSYKLNENMFYLDGSFYKKSEKFDEGKKNWTTAYKEAKAMKFNGLDGYLMTITSDAENKFVYDQVFKGEEPDDVGSWIGGTRQKPTDKYDSATWSTNGYNQYWSWACGPEAGKTFYTNTFSRKGQDYRAEGMYSSWSNPDDCDLNGISIAYSDDYEPNNQNNSNYNTVAPNGNYNENREYFLQYTGRYVWNDTSAGTGTQKRWKVHYYVVEFTPYENKDTKVLQQATAPRLHAEQKYE